MDLLSVVVPMYRVEKYLHNCIDSILNQTYRNFELILVNDGSPDKCGEIAEEYCVRDSRIKVIHKQNGGLSSARNSGIDIASGKYILFIDSDDGITDNFLSDLYEASVLNNCDAVICGFKLVPNNNQIVPSFELNTVMQGRDLILNSDNVHSSNDLCFTWRYLFKLDIIRSKNIRFNEKVLIAEDTIFNLEFLLESKRVIAIPNVLYLYTVNNPDSIMRIPYKPNLESSLVLQYQIKRKLSEKFDLIKDKKYKKDLANYYVKTILRMMINNLKNSPETDKISGLYRIVNYKMVLDSVKEIGLRYECENYKEYLYYLALKFRIYPILKKELLSVK